MLFSNVYLRQHLEELNETQESIQCISMWAMLLVKYAKNIALGWHAAAYGTGKDVGKKLTLMYLCNEILQASHGEDRSVFRDAFSPFLPDAVANCYASALAAGDDGVKKRVDKVLDVWRSRQVIKAEVMDKLTVIQLSDDPLAALKRLNDTASIIINNDNDNDNDNDNILGEEAKKPIASDILDVDAANVNANAAISTHSANEVELQIVQEEEEEEEEEEQKPQEEIVIEKKDEEQVVNVKEEEEEAITTTVTTVTKQTEPSQIDAGIVLKDFPFVGLLLELKSNNLRNGVLHNAVNMLEPNGIANFNQHFEMLKRQLNEEKNANDKGKHAGIEELNNFNNKILQILSMLRDYERILEEDMRMKIELLRHLEGLIQLERHDIDIIDRRKKSIFRGDSDTCLFPALVKLQSNIQAALDASNASNDDDDNDDDNDNVNNSATAKKQKLEK